MHHDSDVLKGEGQYLGRDETLQKERFEADRAVLAFGEEDERLLVMTRRKHFRRQKSGSVLGIRSDVCRCLDSAKEDAGAKARENSGVEPIPRGRTSLILRKVLWRLKGIDRQSCYAYTWYILTFEGISEDRYSTIGTVMG